MLMLAFAPRSRPVQCQCQCQHPPSTSTLTPLSMSPTIPMPPATYQVSVFEARASWRAVVIGGVHQERYRERRRGRPCRRLRQVTCCFHQRSKRCCWGAGVDGCPCCPNADLSPLSSACGGIPRIWEAAGGTGKGWCCYPHPAPARRCFSPSSAGVWGWPRVCCESYCSGDGGRGQGGGGSGRG